PFWVTTSPPTGGAAMGAFFADASPEVAEETFSFAADALCAAADVGAGVALALLLVLTCALCFVNSAALRHPSSSPSRRAAAMTRTTRTTPHTSNALRGSVSMAKGADFSSGWIGSSPIGADVIGADVIWVERTSTDETSADPVWLGSAGNS